MTFEEAMKAYWQLRARYEANQITAKALENAVQGWQVRDERGQVWQIGAQNGNWYRLEDNHWVEDFPPPNPAESISAKPATSAPARPKQKGCVIIIVIVISLVCILGACGFIGRLWSVLQYW